MVMANDRHDRVREFDFGKNLRPHLRVRLDSRKFRVGEFARLVQDVFGHGELADVVQQRACFDRAQLLAVLDADACGERDGPALDATDMSMRDLVLRVDCVGERLDGREVQPVDLRQVIELIGNTAGCVPVGEMQDERDEERHRHHHEAVGAQPEREHHEPRAEGAADEREPEALEVSTPDGKRTLAFVERNRDGNRSRVQEEIQPGEEQQPGEDHLDAKRLAIERLQS